MKTRRNLLFVLSILSVFIACDNSRIENDTPIVEDENIVFLKSSLGGCNNQTAEMIKRGEETVIPGEKSDTAIIRIERDTLTIFVGLNYVCCAPFVTDCDIVNDSIFVTITDTIPENGSYCKCHCYYTFTYYFSYLSNRSYYWRITLIDPREEDEKLFYEGIINAGN
ncbi:MAG: hypothetical protein ACOX32_03100 [Bacteroidaceae bacterium]|jgi:hypothetical protein|nr:hypothetical protein [Bacteroidaceae bacterium]MBP8603166.1 hypothetical protein [Bacteroidaceae bacterium]HOD67875.1 hypothetical protein [Bacteroidaceae bacterium]HQL25412.1 hypothetical protein [Bacteroidaceae bacterium]